MSNIPYYKMKHIPTGLYFQPHKHRGSHLSKSGKVYHTKFNGVETGQYGRNTFRVWCEKGSSIHKLTQNVLVWEPGISNQLIAETQYTDWVRELI